MTDRLHIEISGNLPDAGKYAILASAEEAMKETAAALAIKHEGLTLSVSVRAVRPGKKTGAPEVRANGPDRVGGAAAAAARV